MRRSLVLLVAMLAVLTLTLTACSPAGTAVKDKIVGKYTSDFFSSQLELDSIAQMFGVESLPEGDNTVYVEFTADGKMRPLIGDKDMKTFLTDLVKDLPEEVKANMSSIEGMLPEMAYAVKNDTTLTLTMGDEAIDLTMKWEGNVMTLTGPDNVSMTFTKVTT